MPEPIPLKTVSTAPVTRTEYRAYTALGVLIRTFESRDMALAWLEIDGPAFPGARIVERTETLNVRERTIGGRLKLVAN